MLEALRELNMAALLTLLSGNLEEALENQLQYKVIGPEHLRDKYNSESKYNLDLEILSLKRLLRRERGRSTPTVWQC